MRRLWMLFAVALIVGFAATAMAEEKGLGGYGGEVSLNYWIADMDASYSVAGAGTWDEGSDQGFFPSLKAIIGVAPEWSVIGEYSDSGKDSISPEQDPDNPVHPEQDAQYILFGGRYDFESGAFANLAYQSFKTSYSDDDPADAHTGKIDGFRIGGGYGKRFENSPWSVSGEIGFGIANDAKFSDTDGSYSADASVIDFELTAGYHFENGLVGNIGYRLMNIDCDETVELPSIEYDIDGFFLGVGYDF